MKIPKMCSPGHPLSDDALMRIQREFGVVFPQSFLQFLRECNGGYVDEECAYYYQVPTEFDDSCIGVSCFYSVSDNPDMDDYDQLESNIECYRGRIPDDLLPIASDSFGNQICLGLSGDRAGQVVFWNHEIEGDDMYSSFTTTVSPSLEHFLDHLGPYRDEQ